MECWLPRTGLPPFVYHVEGPDSVMLVPKEDLVQGAVDDMMRHDNNKYTRNMYVVHEMRAVAYTQRDELIRKGCAAMVAKIATDMKIDPTDGVRMAKLMLDAMELTALTFDACMRIERNAAQSPGDVRNMIADQLKGIPGITVGEIIHIDPTKGEISEQIKEALDAFTASVPKKDLN